MLDNDDAGVKGTKSSLRSLQGKCSVKVFQHHPSCKDPGDIITKEMNNDEDIDFIHQYYKSAINNLVR